MLLVNSAAQADDAEARPDESLYFAVRSDPSTSGLDAGAKKEGKTAALLEQERPNLFWMNVAVTSSELARG